MQEKNRTMPPLPEAPAEPLARSAPIAWRAAPETCNADAPGAGGCAWYHGLWQYLRLLGLVTAPPAHGRFFIDTLAGLARRGECARVLISGSADYALLALVVHALRPDPDHPRLAPQITVVDRCETPLLLNRWYAREAGVAVETGRSDILRWGLGPGAGREGNFDVVCTHSFLGYFTDPQRAALMARWHALLRPGGRVVTINRVRPAHRGGFVGFGPEQAHAFGERVREEARRRSASLDLDADTLAGAALLYTQRFRVRAVASRRALAALFEEGGFTVEHLDAEPSGAGPDSSATGPTTPAGADYAHLVARRS